MAKSDAELLNAVYREIGEKMALSYDTSCLPGVVHVYHGAKDKDINQLIDERYYDPISGFPGYKSYCCRLSKKEDGHE